MSQSLLEQIEIERLGRDHYRLVIPRLEGRIVEIHSSLSADVDSGVCAITAVVDDQPVEIAGLPAAARHFFHVYVDGEHRGIIAHRHVPLEGTPNFRDFGGYANREGRFVRWGRLYRSGMLSALTETDLEHFENLGIGLVCDFRGDEERAREPSRWPRQTLPRMEALPLNPGNLALTFKNLRLNEGSVGVPQVVEAMRAINREFVLEHAALYARLMHLVLESDKAVLIHCAAGKDRTGFGAAIILAALGVDEETILRDYMMTAKYFIVEREIERLTLRHSLPYPPSIIEPMISVQPDYLQAAFDSIRKEYGDIDRYLKEALNFDASATAELKARLLI